MTLLGTIAAAMAARNPELAPQAALLPVLVRQLHTYPGRVEGLLELFDRGGLGQHVASWISNGPNMPVTPEQLAHVLGADLLNQLASESGLEQPQVLSALAIMLPSLVNQATPNGRIEPGRLF
ncbi:MAG: DUF937 domain-containing protein [Alcaligenaceae bacterium]|nr:DUF937 domain-containing protein [Alcaligenaceae bacterium]